MYYAIAAAVLLLLLIPLIVPVYVRIEDSCGKRARLVIRFLGFTLFKASFFLYVKNNINPQLLMRNKRRTRVAFDLKSPLHKRKKNIFLSAIRRVFYIKLLDLTLFIGTGDAAATSLLCGSIQNAAAQARGVFSRRIARANVLVSPDFEKKAFSFRLRCIIRVRSADIIRELIHMKGGKKNASDRKHTQDHDVRA